MPNLRSLSLSVIGAGCGLFVLAAFFFPAINRQPSRDYCVSHQKQISLGIKQYVEDYDEHLPLVSAGREGWAIAVQPYIKSTQVFQCPLEATLPDQSSDSYQEPLDSQSPAYTDYFYNARLNGREEATIGEVSHIVLIADGNDGIETTDSTYAKSAVPAAWRTDPTSPAFRIGEKRFTPLSMDMSR